jgi:hypothetical protein
MSDKEQFTAILQEVFAMIEDLDVNEGLYLQFADMFKQMNLKVERLTQIQYILADNRYYQRHIRRSGTTLVRQRLTEAQKRASSEYQLCECGRYVSINPRWGLDHIKTLVHHQGLRNRKYARRGLRDEVITDHINREVAISGWCFIHRNKQLKNMGREREMIQEIE